MAAITTIHRVEIVTQPASPGGTAVVFVPATDDGPGGYFRVSAKTFSRITQAPGGASITFEGTAVSTKEAGRGEIHPKPSAGTAEAEEAEIQATTKPEEGAPEEDITLGQNTLALGEDTIRQALRGMGVDEGTQAAILGDPDVMAKLSSPAGFQLLQAASEPIISGGYTEAVAGAGFPLEALDIVEPGQQVLGSVPLGKAGEREQVPIKGYTTESGGVQSPMAAFHQTAEEFKEAKGQRAPYTVQPESGALLYANGVLVGQPGNPGSVIYPPTNPNIPGSPAWLADAQENWTPEQIAEWRQRLYGDGYTVDKKGGWDIDLVNALGQYHATTYANFGTPLPASQHPGGVKKEKPLNLSLIRGQIENTVVEQFRQLYGGDPSAKELNKWTAYIIDVGMKLQRQGLSPDAAAAEAGERFVQQAEGSPETQWVQEREEENTTLRDALTNMVQVHRSLVG